MYFILYALYEIRISDIRGQAIEQSRSDFTVLLQVSKLSVCIGLGKTKKSNVYEGNFIIHESKMRAGI